MIYTLIGSRSTPQDVLNLMTKFAYKAASKGYTVRSGAADGADTCAEEGVLNFIKDNNLSPEKADSLMEIYLPWKDFNGRKSSDYGYKTLPILPCKSGAFAIAERIHPAWERCSNGARSLHARNTMQCLGENLDKPSRFILCYGESEKKGSVIPKGGTRSCCKLGEEYNVEIFNLYLEEHLKRVEEWVNE